MILIDIDRSSDKPVYQQINDGIVALIEEGSLRPGDRFPPTRVLARGLGVHRSTVLRAYDELRALGYLESAAGAYSTVRRRHRIPTVRQTRPDRAGCIKWGSRMVQSTRAAGVSRTAGQSAEPIALPAGVINFDTLAPDPTLAPCDELRRAIKRILVRNKAQALDYTDPAGWRPLRESVAARLRVHGMAVSPDEILITNGAQQALDLILRLLVTPADAVAVEAPTYGMAHALLRIHRAHPIEIPMTDQGMDLKKLEKALASGRPKLVYTMPNFHNPMGVTTDQAHRERLLALGESYRVPIVEDAFDEEMKYFGKAVLPIKSMDVKGVVFYVGTFSKVVFSGLRVGWIAAPPEVIGHLKTIQYASCLSVNTLAQAALERLTRGGEFEAHLRRVHTVYRRRMRAMLAGLERHLPYGISWTKPTGGYTLWLTLPRNAGNEETLCDELKKKGVAVAPGERFFGRRQAVPHIRLSIATVDQDAIEKGCRRIGGVLSKKNLKR